MKCQICGKGKVVTYRWFVYDNGDQFTSGICVKCVDLYSELLKKGKLSDYN